MPLERAQNSWLLAGALMVLVLLLVLALVLVLVLVLVLMLVLLSAWCLLGCWPAARKAILHLPKPLWGG